MATIHELAQDSLEYRRQIDSLREENKRLRKALKRNRVYTFTDTNLTPKEYCNECLELIGKCSPDCEVAALLEPRV